MKKNFLLTAIIALLVSCGTTVLLTPTQADVSRVNQKYPSLTLGELQQGKALYEQHCGACHGLKKPESRTEDQWNKVVPRMVQKVNNKAGKEVFNGTTQETLLKYLVTMSMAKPL